MRYDGGLVPPFVEWLDRVEERSSDHAKPISLMHHRETS